MIKIFESSESNVRSYCRNFTDVFNRAKGSILYSMDGKEYIDFFAGAGALNYGHNNDFIKEKVLAYLEEDGIMHGLDMYTKAKKEFMEKFWESIMKPRNLDYKLQFCGPTGTNAVEAALKLARKVKNRSNIFSFMGAFHGMSLGSLAATSNRESREGAGLSLLNVTFMPYPNSFMNEFDTIDYIERVLNDDHSGIDKPAAIIVETIQAEGGVIVAPIEWLQRLSNLCKKHDILLICDEVQVGCGRAGEFFSFERAGIVPDMVVLSKSIGGYGLPMSLLLIKPELDIWKPAEHNGTFRGNQLAFVAAQAALEYREKVDLDKRVKDNERFIEKFLKEEIASLNEFIEIRGCGMIWGIDVSRLGDASVAKQIATECYKRGLVIERAGRDDAVVKLLPPLTIERSILERGCEIIKESAEDVIKSTNKESYVSFSIS
ncbi:diaminobutyrate--2-oxoglutarate transaminase [Wukongibacter sp. M2B1]|uniref:diaminobutyrate--2-oxoglutarate transaminase n=1 Tax=Wukongibacter sp. M2B1 TaxID=3088895 RepID=UPI003D79AE76